MIDEIDMLHFNANYEPNPRRIRCKECERGTVTLRYESENLCDRCGAAFNLFGQRVKNPTYESQQGGRCEDAPCCGCCD